MLFNEILGNDTIQVAECSFEHHGDIEAATEFALAMLQLRKDENAAEEKALEGFQNVVKGAVAMESFEGELKVMRESFLSDWWEKLKAALKKLWAKVKGWFASLKKWIRDKFIGDEKWFNENQAQIKANGKNTVEVNTYAFSGDYAGIMKKIESAAELKGYTKFYNDVKSVDSDAVTKEYLSKIGVGGTKGEGVETAVRNFCYGAYGAKQKRTVTVSEMVTLYKSVKGVPELITKIEQRIDKMFTAALSENAITSAGEENGSKIKQELERKAQVLRQVLGHSQAATGAVSRVVAACSSFALATIRKGAK